MVFYPSTTQDVSHLLAACNERRIAVTAYGGGTSFGGALKNAGGVCVSFERMASLLRINSKDGDCIVQPGLNWMELNALLQKSEQGKGYMFPVDPSPGATIGGMIAMSCSGTNAYRYGTMREWVVGLTVVLADGHVVKTKQRPRKSSAGYDLTHLIVGCEGTLGLVTEATLRLAPLPRNLHVGVATFEALESGVDVVLELQKSGHVLEALELADGKQMECLNVSKLSSIHFAETPTFFFKIAGPSTQMVVDQIDIMKTLCARHKATSIEITRDGSRIAALWGARKAMGTALVAMKQSATDLFIHSDCAVPISKLPALIAGTHDLISAATSGGSKWFCANVGHVGDGNVHSSIICPAEDRDLAEGVIKRICRLALSLEGTVTGEHGVGMKLRDMLEEEVGSVGVGVMRSTKEALDPRGILNPGKVFKLEDGTEKARL